MTTAPSEYGAHWRAVTSRHTFGDVVHQVRINPLSHFPVTVVELRGTGARSRIRLISVPDGFGMDRLPPSGVATRRAWFPDADVWEVSCVAVVNGPPFVATRA
jgi:hypothetical protein